MAKEEKYRKHIGLSMPCEPTEYVEVRFDTNDMPPLKEMAAYIDWTQFASYKVAEWRKLRKAESSALHLMNT